MFRVRNGPIVVPTALLLCAIFVAMPRNAHTAPAPTATPPPPATPTPAATPTATPTATPRSALGNISTRSNVGLHDNVLIAGFIVTGTQAKKVIIRGIGPSL